MNPFESFLVTYFSTLAATATNNFFKKYKLQSPIKKKIVCIISKLPSQKAYRFRSPTITTDAFF